MTEKNDHDLIVEIHTVLLGTNNQGGLLRSHECLKKDFHSFKKMVLIVFAFLVGTGIISFGSIEIAKFLGKMG